MSGANYSEMDDPYLGAGGQPVGTPGTAIGGKYIGFDDPFLQPDPEPEPEIYQEPLDRSWGEAAGDSFGSFAGGVNTLIKTAGDIYGLASGDMENVLSEFGESGADYWRNRKTDYLVGLENERSAKIEAAEGVLGKAGTAFWETLSSPQLLTSFLFEQAPMLIPGAGVGRAAGLATKAAGAGAKVAGVVGTGAAVGTGAVMQGADAGSQAYDQLMAIPDEVWAENSNYRQMVGDGVDSALAKQKISHGLSQDAAIASGIISVGTNMLPGARNLEKALAGVKLPGVSKLGNVATGFVGESIQEGLEEGSGALASNWATQQIDPNQVLSEGVGEAAGLGATAGIFGGAAGLNTNTGDAVRQYDEETERRANLASEETKAGGGDELDAQLAAQQVHIKGDADRPAFQEQVTPLEPLPLDPGQLEDIPTDIGIAPDGFAQDDFLPDAASRTGELSAEDLQAQVFALIDQEQAPEPHQAPVSAEAEGVNVSGEQGEVLPGSMEAPLPIDQVTNTDPANTDLLQAIAKAGGLNREEAETLGIDPKHLLKQSGIRRIFTKNGRSLKEISTALIEQGDLAAAEDSDRLLEKIGKSLDVDTQQSQSELGEQAFPSDNAQPTLESENVVDQPIEITSPVAQSPKSSIPNVVNAESPLESDTAEIDAGAHEAATSPTNSLPEPTEAMKLANNYKKGRVVVNGVKIGIENPKGSVRSGTDPGGNKWENTMAHHYGDLVGTRGADGDLADVFVGPNPESEKVFIIDQNNKDGSFDELKAMVGFSTEIEATDGYKANYSEGWEVGPVTELSAEAFKEKVKDGDFTQAMAKQPSESKPGQEIIRSQPEEKTTSTAKPVTALTPLDYTAVVRNEAGEPFLVNTKHGAKMDISPLEEGKLTSESPTTTDIKGYSFNEEWWDGESISTNKPATRMKTLKEVVLSEDFLGEQDSIVTVTQDAETAVRRLDKRIGVIDKLLGCVK